MPGPLELFHKFEDREQWAKLVDLPIFDKAVTYAIAHLAQRQGVTAEMLDGARTMIETLRVLSLKPNPPKPVEVMAPLDHTTFDTGRRAKAIRQPASQPKKT